MREMYCYLGEHKDQWPDSLDVLIKERSLPVERLYHNGQRANGPIYTYVKPVYAVDDPRQVVFYEIVDKDFPPTCIVVAFLDAHIQCVSTEELAKHLADTAEREKEAREKKAKKEALKNK